MMGFTKGGPTGLPIVGQELPSSRHFLPRQFPGFYLSSASFLRTGPSSPSSPATRGWRLRSVRRVQAIAHEDFGLSRAQTKSNGFGEQYREANRGLFTRFTTEAVRAVAREDILEDLDLDAEEGFVEPKRPLRPVVERFKIYHEKNISEERLKELGVSRWSKWDCGPGVTYFWEWKVDELVYISKGSVEVVPNGCHDGAFFYAGDLVRFPKWFEASLTFDEDYEQHSKFLAYGD